MNIVLFSIDCIYLCINLKYWLIKILVRNDIEIEQEAAGHVEGQQQNDADLDEQEDVVVG